MQSPDPRDLAEHWGRIIGIAASQSSDGDPEIVLVNCRFRFTKGASDAMSGLTLQVSNVATVLEAAKAKGYAINGNSFALGGVDFHLVA
jgi:hypothetical protein